MTKQDAGYSSDFISRQRERLLEMEQEFLGHANKNHRSETLVAETPCELNKQGVHTLNAGQKRFNSVRLGDVQRALQKIEDGTYGLSDESGDQIPRARLEAFPDALFTEREEEEREEGK